MEDLALGVGRVVCIPEGHFAAPVALFLRRFVNAEYRTIPADWLIPLCAVLGIVVSLVSWRLRGLSVALGTVALYFGAVALAVSEWSSPLDHPITIITAMPFAGIAASIAWKCASARGG